jgi:uncharacterized membrane protein
MKPCTLRGELVGAGQGRREAPMPQRVNLLGLLLPAYNLRLSRIPRSMSSRPQEPWIHVASGSQHEWLLRRNCSLAPGRLAMIFGAVAGLSLVIGVAFAMSGAWLVLPFAFIEVLALGIAFLVHARHTTDYERIVLRQDCLLVETCEATKLHREQYLPSTTRVEYSGSRRELIGLAAAGRRIEVGRFVPESERPQLATQLRTQLRGFAN